MMLFVAGCGSESGFANPTEPAPAASLTAFESVQSIFGRTCAFSGCHSGPAAQEGLSLAADDFYAHTVRVAAHQVPGLYRVDPGSPESSYLLLKLEGLAGSVGGIGTQMPLGGQLTTAQIDSVRAWIQAGAPNQ